MYSNMTFDDIMERCLLRVNKNMDSREGSIIYDALAPAVAELSIMYIELSTLMDRAFPDTATGMDLDRKAAERGLFRRAATFAERRALLQPKPGATEENLIGQVFTGGKVNYVVVERKFGDYYLLRAMQAGRIGNEYLGTLFPVGNLELASAVIGEIERHGEDEESDDNFRARYFDSIDSQAFGGNRADYRNRVRLMDGIGDCKVFPACNGGGTVKVVFVTSEYGVPSQSLVESTQKAIDPEKYKGEGMGFAPIGHVVTVEPAEACPIDVSFRLSYVDKFDWRHIESDVKAAIREYFREQAESWAESESIIVRVTQIESKILGVNGIEDITDCTINGSSENITLKKNEIPMFRDIYREINIHAALEYEDDKKWGDVKDDVTQALDAYFDELIAQLREQRIAYENRGENDEQEEPFIVIQVEEVKTRILGVEGISNVGECTVETATEALSLKPDELPMLGEVR